MLLKALFDEALRYGAERGIDIDVFGGPCLRDVCEYVGTDVDDPECVLEVAVVAAGYHVGVKRA